jgi:hypothetical protein
MDNSQKARNSGAYVGAAILIVIGLIALVANLGGSSYVYQSIPLVIGVAFLLAYSLTRQYGFLVPGGILTGVGAGVLTSSLSDPAAGGAYVVLAIGLGFLLIFAVDVLVSRATSRWWPVIPGGLMLLIGTGIASDSEGVTRQLQVWSPVLLIALGVLILLARVRERGHTP